jgi:transcriptional regulator with XRE-family HTH domain
MAGHRPFRELVEKMSPERQARAKAKTQEMLAEMELAEARQFIGMTQKELAAALGITQPSLSKMEGQTDIRVSTLNRFVQSLGGTLELIAHLPSGDFRLTQFTDEQLEEASRK